MADPTNLPRINLRARIGAKREIRVTDLPAKSGDAIAGPALGKVCVTCCKNEASYCCPTCFASYCTSACYKNHSADCTEAFSKERVRSVINLENAHRQRDGGNDIDDMLRQELCTQTQVHEVTEPPNSDNQLPRDPVSEEMVDRILAKMQLGEDSQLSQQEKSFLQNEMKVFARKQRCAEPWWMVRNEMQGSSIHISSPIGMDSKPPSIQDLSSAWRSIPRIQSITRKDVPDSIIYHVLAMLMGYVVVVRAHDGDWRADPSSALEALIKSSPVYDSSFKPSSIFECIHRWLAYRPTCVQKFTRNHTKMILEDVLQILHVPQKLDFALLECFLIPAVYNQTCSNAALIEASYQSFRESPLIPEMIVSYLEKWKCRATCGEKMIDMQVECDKMVRKAYYLLICVMDPLMKTTMSSLHGLLSSYVQEFL